MGKSKEEIELASEWCPRDCIYLTYIDGWCPACYYAATEHQVRGCKISECDKYTPGEKIRARMKRDYVIWWELELYGEDADPLW